MLLHQLMRARSNPPQRRIDLLDIKRFRVKFASVPFDERIMLFMPRVGDCFEEFRIAIYAADIFRRNGAFSVDTDGIISATSL